MRNQTKVIGAAVENHVRPKCAPRPPPHLSSAATTIASLRWLSPPLRAAAHRSPTELCAEPPASYHWGEPGRIGCQVAEQQTRRIGRIGHATIRRHSEIAGAHCVADLESSHDLRYTSQKTGRIAAFFRARKSATIANMLSTGRKSWRTPVDLRDGWGLNSNCGTSRAFSTPASGSTTFPSERNSMPFASRQRRESPE